VASSSGGQIVALCAKSFCERVLSEANDVCHDGWKYASRYGRDQHVGCVTYESKIHATHA